MLSGLPVHCIFMLNELGKVAVVGEGKEENWKLTLQTDWNGGGGFLLRHKLESVHATFLRNGNCNRRKKKTSCNSAEHDVISHTSS